MYFPLSFRCIDVICILFLQVDDVEIYILRRGKVVLFKVVRVPLTVLRYADAV